MWEGRMVPGLGPFTSFSFTLRLCHTHTHTHTCTHTLVAVLDIERQSNRITEYENVCLAQTMNIEHSTQNPTTEECVRPNLLSQQSDPEVKPVAEPIV